MPLDLSKADPAEMILDETDEFGADCGVQAVGYQAHNPSGEEHPEFVLDNLVITAARPSRRTAG